MYCTPAACNVNLPGVLFEAGVNSFSKLFHPKRKHIEEQADVKGKQKKRQNKLKYLEISLSPLTSGLKRTMALRRPRVLASTT